MVEANRQPQQGMKKSSSSTATSMEQKKKQSRQPPESPSYRLALKSLFSCRNSPADSSSRKKQLGGCSSAPSICKQDSSESQRSSTADKNKSKSSSKTPPTPPPDATTDQAATAAKRRASVSGSERRVKKPLSLMSEVVVSSSSSSKLMRRGAVGVGGSLSSSSSAGSSSSFRLRRLSGCYECHTVMDPISSSSSSMSRAICPCPDCGEIFVRQESLQLHQATRHAVCELASDDTSRNIIDIIFQSSWLKKQSPVCRVERILKVHNTPRTLARFEGYRDAVKAKARRSHHPRCTADGNELLRFHCAALGCALGQHGATHLCGACATCAVIRDGFVVHDAAAGIRTMATSGRAHDAAAASSDDHDGSSSRAMLVCRVIAGRVKRTQLEQEEEEEEYESVAGSAGVYSNMEELQVFNPTAILPCFVVIYKA